jgi:WD40 repeat protein
LVDSIKEHSQRINSLAFSYDGTRVASGSDDMGIGIWDARIVAMAAPGPVEGHIGPAESVVFSSNEKIWSLAPMAILSASGTRNAEVFWLRYWELQFARWHSHLAALALFLARMTGNLVSVTRRMKRS